MARWPGRRRKRSGLNTSATQPIAFSVWKPTPSVAAMPADTDGVGFHTEKAMGWVADVFGPERLRRLPGHRAIGHVRYSTAGSSNIRNAQPITANTARGPVAIAHNGNLTNAETLRRDMERDGAIF